MEIAQTIIDDLARAIRVELWNDPELRAPLLSWIRPTLHRWSIEETERSLMIAEMLGGEDFEWR
jgi:hypothetical protein